MSPYHVFALGSISFSINKIEFTRHLSVLSGGEGIILLIFLIYFGYYNSDIKSCLIFQIKTYV